MMQNDIRAELIKQFPAEVAEVTSEMGSTYYICPTCKRAVALKNDKCESCGQVLNWEHIRQFGAGGETRMASLSFEVSADFVQGDCRKCPISYITKDNSDSVYECPLKMRSNCQLEIKD